MDRLTYMSADPEIRVEYKARIRKMNRIRASQTVKYKEGLAAKGANEKAVAVAKTMLKHGDDIDYISLVSGLTVDEIKKLNNNIAG